MRSTSIWPDHRFAVEVDGWRFHSGRRAFEDDRRKDQDLRRAGIDTMRTTGRQLKEQAYALVAGVAVGLARSAATTAARRRRKQQERQAAAL